MQKSDSVTLQDVQISIGSASVIAGSAESALDIKDLLTNQPTVLRLLPRIGLDTQTSMDLVCLGGIILAFVAMVTRQQRNSIVFGLMWVLYFSMFQVSIT